MELMLVDEYGRTHGRVKCEVPENVAFMGDRIGGEVALGVLGNFDQVVEVLKEKKLRRDMLPSFARQMGDALADHLEDREGWHGEGRRERIEEIHKDSAR